MNAAKKAYKRLHEGLQLMPNKHKTRPAKCEVCRRDFQARIKNPGRACGLSCAALLTKRLRAATAKARTLPIVDFQA